MTTGPCWADAEKAVLWLQGREACAEILRLLARLPLLDLAVLQQLCGLRGGASLYRSVARLQEAGLVGTIRPPVYRDHSPRLHYLTDLGLATLAFDQNVELNYLARRLHLRGPDLLALIPRLPDLLATYELLGALAASRPGRPRLLAWERPWRRSCRRPTAKTPTSVTVPAHAVLAWDREIASYLLLPDRGTVPPCLYRPILDHLLLLRRSRDGCLPALIITTTSRERVAAWGGLLEEVSKARREPPLVARIIRWSSLPADVECLPTAESEGQGASLTRPIQLPPLRPRHAAGRLPGVVGEALRASTSPGPEAPLGQIGLVVTPADHDLLELVGLHPFLCPEQMATVLGWEVASVRRRMNRLMALGLLRQLEEGEIRSDITRELSELTETGLKLAAAHLGLSLAVGIRELGLTGGGPHRPLGPHRKLLRNLAHTREADEIFVRFYRLAREQVAMGSDDAMEEWQNAAACSRRHLRPDGYGVYRRHGVPHGFFLELDRGTMNARDYFKKFAAYYQYGMSGRFHRDYCGYPTILFVAASNAGEERVARVARAAAIGRPGKLPLLLTSQWRVDEVNHGLELLGPIWREPQAGLKQRCHWLPCASDPRRDEQHSSPMSPRGQA